MLFALLLALAPHTAPGFLDPAGLQASGRDPRSVLETGRRERRPVRLRVQGRELEVRVVRLQEAAVEVRRPDHSRLLIRLDRIEAAALQ
jgi:hypothetical protein